MIGKRLKALKEQLRACEASREAWEHASITQIGPGPYHVNIPGATEGDIKGFLEAWREYQAAHPLLKDTFLIITNNPLKEDTI